MTSAGIVLQGTRALVTGGGRGIGAATATTLAAAGAEVAICARSEDELAATAEAILAATGRRVLVRRSDVTVPADVAALAEFLRESWGGLDVLVNNAATLGPVGTLTEVAIEDWVAALSSNVGSVAAVSRAMIPLMSGGGSIVNLAGGGVGGPTAQERVSAYVAAKAAVVVLTELLAREVAPLGIRVNAVAPGAAATRFLDPILEAGPQRAGAKTYEDAAHQDTLPAGLEGYHPLVAWLASDASSWVSGRLLSARWDSAERLESLRGELEGSSWLTLRRIDGALFGPLSETRSG